MLLNKCHKRFSIIVPTLNQCTKLSRCLKHLSELDFDEDLLEVLVVDNGSTDDTKSITLSFKSQIKNLKYIFCGAPGLMAARHRGAEEAKEDILCYIDDDSLVHEGWLQGIDDAFGDEIVAIVGGPCMPEYETDPPDWVEYFWRSNDFGRINPFLSLIDFGHAKRVIDPRFVYGCNFSIRKDIFYELGGTHPDYFPEKLRAYQGDGEVGFKEKVISSGYKTVYHPQAAVRHLIPASRLTLDYFRWRAYFNGIHISYSQIRSAGLSAEIPWPRKIVRKSRDRLRGIRERMLSHEPKQVRVIKREIRENQRAGFAYHQEQARTNPKILEWVLRENYLAENGILPV